MTTLKAYSEYEHSGIDWVDKLPKHWVSGPLRQLARIYAGGTPDRSNVEFWQHGSVPWINSGAVNDWVITEPSALITEEAVRSSSTRWVPAKSVVVALAGQGKTKGLTARLEISTTCNQSMAAVVPNRLADYRFLQFWISANYQSVRNLAGGDLRDGLNLQHIGSIGVPIPPVDEQRAIASFLDHETAEIDAFIADQQELIGLLNERRAATITRAVTKGLDPNIPMKDSGVEWLGTVPVSWSVKPFLRLMKDRVDYRGATPTKTDHGVPLITAKNVRPGFIDYDISREFVEEEQYMNVMRRGLPAKGDILLTMEAPLGHVALIDDGRVALAQRIIKFRPADELLSRFALYAMNDRYFQAQMESNGTGSTALGLKASKLHKLRLVLPSMAEQRTIIGRLDHETTEIDAAIADAKEAIDLSKERRAALISAAVTGKIDARDHPAGKGAA